jgi:hypothetical protein
MLHKSVAESLAQWRQMIASHDFSALPALLHPDATFHSPMVFKPYPGAQAVALVLTTAAKVFEDFVYERELASDDGLNLVLEFRARVGERQLKGIDLIRFDEQGKIVDFEVMIRPFNGLQALGAEMGKRLAPFLPLHKTGPGPDPGSPARSSSE